MNLSYGNNLKQTIKLNRKNNNVYTDNNNANNNTYNRIKIPKDSNRGLNKNHDFVSSKNNIDNTIKSLDEDDIMRFMNRYKKSSDNNYYNNKTFNK